MACCRSDLERVDIEVKATQAWKNNFEYVDI